MSIINYQNRLFALQTNQTSYIFTVTESGILEQLYWGKRIERIEDFQGETSAGKTINVHGPQVLREECSSFGGMRFKETSLKVTFADGVGRRPGLPLSAGRLHCGGRAAGDRAAGYLEAV